MERLGPDPGEEVADEIYPDDGRQDDGEDHKGDWGSHSHADWVHENEGIPSEDEDDDL